MCFLEIRKMSKKGGFWSILMSKTDSCNIWSTIFLAVNRLWRQLELKIRFLEMFWVDFGVEITLLLEIY